MSREFMECRDCMHKTGSPQLCDACLHNRQLVSDLKHEIKCIHTILDRGCKDLQGLPEHFEFFKACG